MQDGLRSESSKVENLNFSDTVSGVDVAVTNVAATSISGTSINATNAVVAQTFTTAYGSGYGTVINNLTAEAIISGGTWCVGSAASGTVPNVVAKAAAASTAQPLGICLADVASGANPNILTQGYYKGMIADDTVATEDGYSVGAGAALNTVGAAAAGTTRGTVVMGAGSEGTTVIYLW